MVLGQRRVADKRGESTTIEPLLSGLPAGIVWTLDALHTSKKTARLITGPLCGHYILLLRAAQPLALRAAQALLAGTDIEFADSMDVAANRGHGRTERRTIRVAGCEDTLFPGARQVFRLRRDTGGLDGVRTSKEIVYGIASMTAKLSPPAHLNHHSRRHWTVENRLHYVGDATFREDASQVRAGNAPRTTATFRNLSINTIRYAGRANVAYTRRDLRNHADAFAVYGVKKITAKTDEKSP
jgi:predicted transposase YbfD/YdcC